MPGIKKFFSFVVCLIIVLSVAPFGFGSPVAAADSSVFVSVDGSNDFGDGTLSWVDTDESGDWSTGDTGPWSTIQYAIDEAEAGITVQVGPGTYDSISISKDITISATEGPTSTAITGGSPYNVTIAHDCSATIDGFWIKDSTTIGIFINGFDADQSVTISNCVITHNDYGFYTTGNLYGTITVTDAIIAQNTCNGIICDSPVLGDIIIRNSTIGSINNDTWNFSGNSENGVWIGLIGSTGQIIAENNTISGNTLSGIYMNNVSNTSILSLTGNTFSTNNKGLYLYIVSATSVITIANNTFDGNTSFGLDNDSGITANASDNWWGDASGPYHDTASPSATGDEVSDDVIYAPWLDGTSPGGSERSYNVRNATQSTTYLGIQQAIDAANDEDSIEVLPGTYNLFSINKDLHVMTTEGPEATKIAASGDDAVTIVTDCSVILEGFNIDGKTPSGVYIESVAADQTITIKNCVVNQNDGYGINIAGVETAGLVTIEGCIIAQNVDDGIKAYNDIAGNLIIRDNIIGSIDNGTWDFNGNGGGISIYEVSGSVDVDNNTISDNSNYGIQVDTVGEAPETLSITSNIIADNGNYGVFVDDIISSTLIFQGNTVTGHSRGLALNGISGSTVTISGNNLNGNTLYGLDNNSGTTVNAVDNWWGTASGPYHLTTSPSSWGDRVSDDIVYSPWKDAAAPGGSQRTYNVRNTTQDITYNGIQSAIDAAGSGDSIEILPGTYYGFDITGNLTIASAGGPEITKIKDGGDYVVSINGSCNIVLDGFDIDETSATNGIQIDGISTENTVHIMGCVINQNGGHGIYLNGSVNGTFNVTDNVIAQNTKSGIYVNGTVNGTMLIQNNTIGSVTSDNWTFTGNTESGIFVYALSGNTSSLIIDNNSIRGNGQYGIWVCSVLSNSSLTVRNNEVSANTMNGVYIGAVGQTSDTVTITGNEIDGNGDRGISFGYITESFVNITDNPSISSNNEEGIYVRSIDTSSTMNITGTVTDNTSTQTISGNGIGANDDNIRIVEVSDDSTLTISGNKVADGNGHGIVVSGINYSIKTVYITGNIIIENSKKGIYIDTISASTLHIDNNPDISDNGEEGIRIGTVTNSSIVTIDGNPKITRNGNVAEDAMAIEIGYINESSNVTVHNNTIYENEVVAIQINTVMDNAELIVDNNAIRDNYSGILVGNIGDAPDTVIISNNTVTGHDGVAGIGIGVDDIWNSTLTITGNTLEDNKYGLYIAAVDDNFTLDISGNEFIDSLTCGFLNNTTVNLTATNNWWGDNSGPYHATLNAAGLGDTVSDYVTFDPWETRTVTPPTPAPVYIPPAPEPVVTVTFLETEDTIQVNNEGIVQEEYSASTSDGDMTLTVPEGTEALDVDGEPITEMTVEPLSGDIPPPVVANVIGIPYDFGPDGATFDPALVITMTYDPADIPEGGTPDDLVIAYFDETSGEWVELETTVDPETNTLTAPVPHFTTFAVLGKLIIEETEPEPVIEQEPETEPVVEPEEEIEQEPVIEEESEPVIETRPDPVVVIETSPLIEKHGLQWWGILLIVLGSLGVIAGLIIYGKRIYIRLMYN